MTVVATRVYRNGVLEHEGIPLADVSDHLEHPDTLVWADFCDPTPQDLAEIAAELGLHELAVEDATSTGQRPKLDVYDTHAFVSCIAVKADLEKGSLVTTEISAFVNSRWIVTVRKGDDFSMEPVLKRWDRMRSMTTHGASVLLYGLLDVVVDQYFTVVDAFDQYYDEVSEGLFADEPLDPVKQKHWFHMRRALVRFHRLVVPTREAISGLMRRDHAMVSDAIYPYYQDVYDHILRISESSESLRDLVGTIVETNISLRDFRQNQIVKKVTGWAAILAVPTLVTGFYGMNVPFPGSGQTWGAIVSVVSVPLVSFLLYLTFKRRDWL